jgi:cytochrome c
MQRLCAVLVLTLALAGCGKGAEDEAKPPYDEALYEHGATVFVRRCSTCHDIAGDPHRAGPMLGGIKGRVSGSVHGFGYSQALQDAKIVWSAQTLDRWLAGPGDFVPGTIMQIDPITDPAERKALIEYLINQ